MKCNFTDFNIASVKAFILSTTTLTSREKKNMLTKNKALCARMQDPDIDIAKMLKLTTLKFSFYQCLDMHDIVAKAHDRDTCNRDFLAGSLVHRVAGDMVPVTFTLYTRSCRTVLNPRRVETITFERPPTAISYYSPPPEQ